MKQKTKILILGRNLDELYGLLTKYPVKLVTDDPDIIITYGGDGALLGAERDFPGIPKYPLRDDGMNPKCEKHTNEYILNALFAGRLKSNKLFKLTGLAKGHAPLFALNDIIVHNADPRSAVRYKITINDKHFPQQIVGDGLVVSTPFGSTAYYRSITHSTFNVGIGLAFNNSTEPLHHMVISEDSKIKVNITRGPAILLADNKHEFIKIDAGAFVTIYKTNDAVEVFGLDIFRCEECRLKRNKFWRNKLQN